MTKAERIKKLEARMKDLNDNPPKAKVTVNPIKKKKQMNNLSMGVLVILGMIASVAAFFAVIAFAPILIVCVFYIVKWGLFIGLIGGVIWVIGMGANKLRRVN